MDDRRTFQRGRAVPGGRLSRLARFGGLAGGVAGSMLIEGASRLASGRRPRLSDLILTPGNVHRVTDKLANLRGAAMKMGQLLSMDAGDLLPPELSEIMARLRSDAEPMPRRQLQAVLDRNWGAGWRERFARFDDHPIAAASIGQVHRARTTDGRDLAIKVQYPGVRRSIDSDVDNVSTLLRLSGLVPRNLDVSPLLAEAKRQLHEEADYRREADCIERFASLLKDDSRFSIPAVHRDFSTGDVLAMTYLESDPIETLFDAPQDERDRIAATLIDLVLDELFRFKLMQTDPNLANYRYDQTTGRIVLLDFGATREFPGLLVEQCRTLARAGMSADRTTAHDTIIAMGLLNDRVPRRQHEEIMALFENGMGFLRRDRPFDFGNDQLLRTMRDQGLELAQDRQVYLLPPVDTLFLQRKFGGLYLLALRLKARVDVKRLLAPHLAGDPGDVGRESSLDPAGVRPVEVGA